MATFTEDLLVPVGTNLAKLHVKVHEPQTVKATVFCMHGFLQNGAVFDFLGSFLSQHGYRVVAPDMFGRGRSAFFHDIEAYPVARFITAMDGLSRYGSAVNHALGTSWGGIISAIIHGNYKTGFRSLILNDVGIESGDGWLRRLDVVRGELGRNFATKDEALDHLRATRSYMGEAVPEAMAAYLDSLLVQRDGTWQVSIDPVLADRFDDAGREGYSLYEALKNVSGRLLLLYGAQSAFNNPEHVRRLQAMRPDVYCVDNLQAGHPPSLMTLSQALIVKGFLDMG
jgi:pimeloyl-ACP methyl ester carboxylesterase